jgi:hypothetical protein
MRNDTESMQNHFLNIRILFVSGLWIFLLLISTPPLEAQQREIAGYSRYDALSLLKAVPRSGDSDSATLRVAPNNGFPEDIYLEIAGQSFMQPLASFRLGAGKLDISTGCDTGLNNPIGRYQAVWVNSISYEHELFGEGLTGYVDFSTEYDSEQGSGWYGILTVGIVYSFEKNTYFDLAVQSEQSDAGNQIIPFLGIRVHF